jgi:hypothetical protein
LRFDQYPEEDPVQPPIFRGALVARVEKHSIC